METQAASWSEPHNAGIHELGSLISENILSVVVLITMSLSTFVAVIFTLVFIFKPFDQEAKEETSPLLLNAQYSKVVSAQLGQTQEQHQNETWSVYVKMALLAIAYALIIAVRFNAIKALLQLSWPSDDNEIPEVVY